MVTDNPFSCLNVEGLDIQAVRSMRVDRAEELNQCVRALIERRHNVLLYGNRGVGKSFLLRLLDDHLQQEQSSIFPIFVRLSGLGCYGKDDIAASFSRAVLLQVCCEAWTKLLCKRYLDLRERLDESGNEITFRSESERTIQRIYDVLMTSERKAKSRHFASFGVSAGIKGEKQEEAEYERQQSDVLPFEFAEFISEITRYVLMPKNKKRLLILCDEANHMPMFYQQEILERYFELFNAKQVQFLFVAGVAHWEESPSLPTCFETQFELKGFSAIEDVLRLVQKAKSSLPFEDEAINVLFNEHNGHPRRILETCHFAFEQAVRRKSPTITVDIVHRVCKEIRQKLEKERSLM
jgi:Cdc6-like AAA superfamily ATPase